LVYLGVAWQFLAFPQSSWSFGGGGKRGKVRPKMAPESTQNGANLAQGSARGTRKLTKIWTNRNNANANTQMRNKNTLFLCAAISSKNGGLNGCAFTDVF